MKYRILEQRIPLKPIDRAYRIWWLSHPKAQFKPLGPQWIPTYLRGLITRIWNDRKLERAQ